jgi:hypothetical protein
LAIYEWREFVDQGGLMSYGPSIPDLFRRAAVFYIDTIPSSLLLRANSVIE